VKFLDCESGLFEVGSGVPQGSHLGPLLFILFVNSVVDAVSDIHISIYADDMKLFLPVKSFDDCFKLQNALNVFVDWCFANKLQLNDDKCNVISFTRRKSLIEYDYRLLNISLERCDSVTDLGVILDYELSMKLHVDYIVSKAMRLLGFIKRFGKEFNDIYVLKTLYFSYVRSTLEFGSVVWSPYFINSTLRIEAVQRNFTRYAVRLLDWRDPSNLPSYDHRLQLLGLESLTFRRKISEVVFCKDVMFGQIKSQSLSSQIVFKDNRFNLRSGHVLDVQSHRTCYGFNNPVDRAMRSYNSHSQMFNDNDSRDVIKKKMKKVSVRSNL